ncbi:MAG: ABC transporter permease [Dehalococcoidia bacterium]
MSEVLHGNLGWSEVVSMPVTDASLQFLPATIELALFSAPLIILIGIFMGRVASAHKDKAIDHISRLVAISGWSLPTFWLGLVLLMVFYGYFQGILPPERLSSEISLYVHSSQFTNYTHINSIDAILNWDGRVLLDSLRHLVLPVITLSAVQVALVMGIMRSSMLEALGKRYIVTAKAKGLSERDVMVKHAQPNALIPVVTVAGYIVALLMNGVVITETVFNYKGIGWWFWQSAINLDIAGVLGFTLFNGVVFVFINLIIDLIYMRIDPRVRLGAGI